MNQTNENKPSTNGMDAKDSRRKFVTGSLAVSLLTVLPNKRVWGTTNACTASGNMSGNMSNPNQASCRVQGMSPTIWKMAKERGSRQVDLNIFHTPWNQVFTGQLPFGFSNKSGKPIMKFIGVDTKKDFSGPDGINAHLVAAFLNAKHGLYPLADGVSAEQYAQGLYEEARKPGNRAKLINAINETYLR